MTSTSDAVETAASRPSWVRIAIAIVFGLLFAFYLYEAISQALQLSQYLGVQNPLLKKVGHDPLAFPWAAIVPLVLMPAVTFVLAFLLGRRRGVAVQVGLFVIALAVLSATSLSLESLASALTRIT